MTARGAILGLQAPDEIDVTPIEAHLCVFPDGERMVLPGVAIMASEMIEDTGRRAPAVHIVSGHDRTVLCMPLTVEAARNLAAEIGQICERLEDGAADSARRLIARAAAGVERPQRPREPLFRASVAAAILALLGWAALIAWAVRGLR